MSEPPKMSLIDSPRKKGAISDEEVEIDPPSQEEEDQIALNSRLTDYLCFLFFSFDQQP